MRGCCVHWVGPCVLYLKMVRCGLCRAHEAAALVQQTADEECDNICSLSMFFLGRVLTDWQAAIMFARSHPYSAHIMVRLISRSRPC